MREKLQRDYSSARMLHEKCTALFELLFIEVNPIPVKAALQLMGLDHGSYRLPLSPPSEAHLDALKACLEELSLI